MPRSDATPPLAFVIAGAAKSGTTALAARLDRHPRIVMSAIKETNYFVHGREFLGDGNGAPAPTRTMNGRLAVSFGNAADHVDSLEKFDAQFGGAGAWALRGEASPLYLLSPEVPDRLLAHHPDVKVVLILRNPTDAAFANLVHHVRDRAETIDVGDMTSFLDDRRYIDPELHPFARHLEIPRYAEQLTPWVARFGPAARLHVEIYEEFQADPDASIARVLQFLDLEPEPPAGPSIAVNQSRLPRSARLHDLVLGDSWLKRAVGLVVPTRARRRARLAVERWNAGERPVLDEATRAVLDARYGADRRYVETLLGRRVIAWRTRLATGGTGGPDGPGR